MSLIRTISESYSKNNCQVNLTVVLTTKDGNRNWDRFSVGERSNSLLLKMNDNSVLQEAIRNFEISKIKRDFSTKEQR